VLALADGFCCAWRVYPISCSCRCPERGTRTMDWDQLSRFQTKKESGLRNVVFLNKNMAMDNVQKYNTCSKSHPSRWFPAWFILQPEDGGDMFLRKFCWIWTDYTVSCLVYSSTWRWRWHVLQKVLLNFDGLHGFLLSLFFNLKMEVTCSSESSVEFQRTTRFPT
jgi:hypothetical protein